MKKYNQLIDITQRAISTIRGAGMARSYTKMASYSLAFPVS